MKKEEKEGFQTAKSLKSVKTYIINIYTKCANDRDRFQPDESMVILNQQLLGSKVHR